MKNVKKIIFVLCILLFVNILDTCSAEEKKEQQKWGSFRGIEWGTNIKDISDDMTLIEDDGEGFKAYVRSSDILKIGSSTLNLIVYAFYKDSFYIVFIETVGYSNFTGLRDAIFSYYGKGNQENEFIDKWIWIKYNVFIELEYNEFSEKTEFIMFYIPISKIKDADDKEKAKGADKDF
jgi:hypothetical protein